MARVKGSKQQKMIVVVHRPLHDILIRAGVVLCMILLSAGFYYFGHIKGVYQNADARAERDLLSQQLEEKSRLLDTLNQNLVNLEQARQVDQQALEDVQSALLTLRARNAQLEEDVLFYKQIMSPENDETGLVIGQLDLLATNFARRFQYQLELKQLSNNQNLINGYVNVNILGIQDGQEVSLPLRSLSPNLDQLDITLQFRYFQNIEGELELPENFIPDKVQILAVAQGANAKTVQKSFGWVVQD